MGRRSFTDGFGFVIQTYPRSLGLSDRPRVDLFWLRTRRASASHSSGVPEKSPSMRNEVPSLRLTRAQCLELEDTNISCGSDSISSIMSFSLLCSMVPPKKKRETGLGLLLALRCYWL